MNSATYDWPGLVCGLASQFSPVAVERDAKMKPQFRTRGVAIYRGDCRDVLAALPCASVQCCVTSPPYWGLRDYGTGKWKGGRRSCDHVHDRGGRSSLEGGKETRAQGSVYRRCRKCGAVREDSQIGLESAPESYIATLVAIFREVRRVLRADGTLWVNMGDSYAGSMKGIGADGTAYAGEKQATNAGSVGITPYKPDWSRTGLKPKDLAGMPWRLAFALQADGWYLRSDIIWHKPNVMPESVKDRPTRSHEYLFLLSKNPRYYYDARAIREAQSVGTHARFGADGKKTRDGSRGRKLEHPGSGTKNNSSFDAAMRVMIQPDGRRNKRTVWTIPTQAYRGAHFATFPQKLIDPCILAGSKPGDTVLDPFFGAGTTGLVARRHNRKVVGIELSPRYIAMAVSRINTCEKPCLCCSRTGSTSRQRK